MSGPAMCLSFLFVSGSAMDYYGIKMQLVANLHCVRLIRFDMMLYLKVFIML